MANLLGHFTGATADTGHHEPTLLERAAAELSVSKKPLSANIRFRLHRGRAGSGPLERDSVTHHRVIR
ncbi:MAG: hypothetical protein QOE12_1028 [Mycobacterium sp.]|nr:hypothetical protein [Mycobacterium sp.]